MSLFKKIKDGAYDIGELITPKEFSKLKLKDDGTFCTEIITIEGRKIPLMRIRQRLLETQEKLNLLRAIDNYNTMPIEDITARLKHLGEFDEALNDDDQRLRLEELETTRYLACWADHLTIAGTLTPCTHSAVCMMKRCFCQMMSSKRMAQA